METISEEELTNIDLDIYDLMKKMPNNQNYNSLYIRYEASSNNSFVRFLCSEGSLIKLLSALFSLNNAEAKKEIEAAFMDISLSILADKSDEEINRFFGFLDEIRNRPPQT